MGVLALRLNLLRRENQNVHPEKPTATLTTQRPTKFSRTLVQRQGRRFHNRQVQITLLIRRAIGVRAKKNDLIGLTFFGQDTDDFVKLGLRDHTDRIKVVGKDRHSGKVNKNRATTRERAAARRYFGG